MCWINDCALYWVSTAICRMPELTQFDSTKSMIMNLPPKGVAGLQRGWVSPLRRSPRPPALRHDHRQGAARQTADVASGVSTSSVSHTYPKLHRESTNQPPAQSQ